MFSRLFYHIKYFPNARNIKHIKRKGFTVDAAVIVTHDYARLGTEVIHTLCDINNTNSERVKEVY